MATRDDVKIQVGHCYLVSILEPFKEINKPSPLKVLFLSHGWYTTNAMSAMKKVKNKIVHLAVVMRYNDTSKTAVILLGTTRPEPQVHRFILCYGVKRHDF
jgi:hydrogenase maturation factor